MAIYGTYNGSFIETEHKFDINQKVMIIPLDNSSSEHHGYKQALIDSLFGAIDDNVSLEEIKEERLKKYETSD